MSGTPELVHVINIVVRSDKTFRVCEVYVPQGFRQREDFITDDVFDALANVHDRAMDTVDTMAT